MPKPPIHAYVCDCKRRVYTVLRSREAKGAIDPLMFKHKLSLFLLLCVLLFFSLAGSGVCQNTPSHTQLGEEQCACLRKEGICTCDQLS